MKLYYKIGFLAVFSLIVFQAASQSYYPPRLWKLMDYSGEASIKYQYLEQETFSIMRDKQYSHEIYGGLSLRTSSYVLSPRFLVLDVGGIYNPGFRKDDHLVFPDQAEDYKLYGCNISTSFFREEPVSFGLSANINKGYTNRENLTDVKYDNKGYGGSFRIRKKWLPFSFVINKQESNNTEMQTGRKYTQDQFSYSAGFTPDLKKIGYVNLQFNHNDNTTNYYSEQSIRTITDMFIGRHRLLLNKKYDDVLNTNITYHNQNGSLQYQQFRLSETVSLKFPYKMFSNDGYSFMYTNQKEYSSVMHQLGLQLGHQWYNSVTSVATYDFTTQFYSGYRDNVHTPGISISYTKKLPLQCKSVVSYNYFKQFQTHNSDPVSIPVVNEQVTIIDGQMILLSRPDIIQTSVFVTNLSGTQIYQQNLDYVLMPRGIYLEIQRIPGGQISNNSSVFVNYTAALDNSYKYNINRNQFNSSLFIYKNMFEIYFNFHKNEYTNVVNIEENRLNYYTTFMYGFRTDFKFLKTGIELTNYKSNMIPYRSERYYLQFQKQYFQKLSIEINGNYGVFHLTDTDEKQEFADILGSIGYKIRQTTEVTLESSYRKQIGRQMDLDLFIARLRFTTSHGKMYLSFGADVYRRIYIGEKLNFNRVYIQLTRKFGK